MRIGYKEYYDSAASTKSPNQVINQMPEKLNVAPVL